MLEKGRVTWLTRCWTWEKAKPRTEGDGILKAIKTRDGCATRLIPGWQTRWRATGAGQHALQAAHFWQHATN